MAKARKLGRTHLLTKVSTNVVRSTAKASMFGPMVVFTAALGSITRSMATAHTSGLMGEFT